MNTSVTVALVLSATLCRASVAQVQPTPWANAPHSNQATWYEATNAAPAPFYGSSFTQESKGWARGAAIFGFASAGIVLAGAVISEDGISGDAGLVIGAVTTAYFAAAVPLTAAGAASGRTSKTQGEPGWRMVGWISYALTLADAGLLLGLGAADVAVPGGPTSVGVIGALACVSMAVDASASASPARTTSATWTPTVGYASVGGKLVPAVGLQIGF